MTANAVAGAGLVRWRSRRRAPYQRTASESLSDFDHHRSFRLSYENLNLLGDEFHQFRLQRLPHARLSTSQSMVNNFLHFLGSGGYYRQTGRAGGVSTPTMHKHANEVAEWISITANRHISLPTASEAPELVAGAIEEKEIIGFLDGFIMHIQRPAYARDAYYCGRPGKNVDGINVQYICDKNGKVCILIILRSYIFLQVMLTISSHLIIIIIISSVYFIYERKSPMKSLSPICIIHVHIQGDKKRYIRIKH